MKFEMASSIAYCLVLFVHNILCDKYGLEITTIVSDEESGTEISNFNIKNSTYMTDGRNASGNVSNFVVSTSRSVEEGVEKLLEVDYPPDKTERKNIQMVAKKPVNLVDNNISNKVERIMNRTQYWNASVSDITWLVRSFSVAAWDAERIPGIKNVLSTCDFNMKEYLRALHSGASWATKMSDATGRYSSQFFFGNDFWLGSKTMCSELENKLYNKDMPPFSVQFFVMKFLLNMLNKTRLMSMGLCLPKACSAADVSSILKSDAEMSRTRIPERSLNVISVREVPGPYLLWEDKKLHLLFGILTAVLILAITGTYYEISLERKQYRWYKNHQPSIMSNHNNNEGDMKIISLELKLQSDSSSNNTTKSSDMQLAYTEGGSAFGKVLLSFSAFSNSKKILHVGPTPEESLTCVHGLRFLSLLWVIVVHTYLQVFTIAENKEFRTLAEKNFMFQIMSNATFSVDTFFFISGLLVTYLYFKSADKEDGRGRRNRNSGCLFHFQKFFRLVTYRFLRLTPAYMFVLLVAEISMRWIHSNSVFEPQSQNHVSCDKYWWRNILYINSLYPMKDMCMLWSWYVSNDTQFYILGVLILLFSIRYFRFSVILLLFFLIASWLVTISISLIYDYRARVDDPFLLFDELYDKPWTRLGPYLIGMCTGYIIFKSKCKLNLSTWTILVFWFMSIFTLLALIYGLHLYPLGAIGSSLFVSLGHTAWGVALAWVVIACCSGHGGFINTLLSFKLLHPLSRLTYCAYLVHPIIMTITNFQMNAPLHLQDSIVIILYFGNTLTSFLLSFCLSLLFEAPAVRLLKLMFSPAQPKRKSSNTDTNL